MSIKLLKTAENRNTFTYFSNTDKFKDIHGAFFAHTLLNIYRLSGYPVVLYLNIAVALQMICL